MAFNPQDRRGSGWSGTAPTPFELDEGKELILNINSEYKDRYRVRLADAAAEEERLREWQVLEEAAPAREGAWTYQVLHVIDRGEDAPCVRIVSYDGGEADIEAPSEIEGLPVWEVAPMAFAHKRTLRSVVIPNTVKRIGHKAFFCDFNLKRVVCSDAAEELSYNVFEQCRELEEVHLPRSLRVMPARLLWDATALDALEIPASVEAISPRSCRFAQMTRLTVSPDNPFYSTDGTCLFSADGAILLRYLGEASYYEVPRGCAEIATDAFKGARCLKRLSLPEGLLRIGERAFYHTGLVELVAPESERLAQPAGRRKPGQVSAQAKAGFPATLVSIGAEAFAHTRLSRANLPAALEEIGKGAFEDTAIRFDNERSFSIDAQNPILFTDHVALYRRDQHGKRLLGLLCDRKRYRVEEGTDEICEGAFSGLRQIATVELPEGLRVIGAHAFEGCANLRSVNLPSTLTTLGERAFYETGVKTVEIGPVLEHIGPLALCTAGADHNSAYDPLRRIKVDPANERFYLEGQVLCERGPQGDAAIASEGAIETLVIPQSVTKLDDLAFAKVTTRELRVHSAIEQVNVRAFLNVEGLERVHVDFPRPVDATTSAELRIPKGAEKARWYLCALRMDEDGLFFDYAAYDAQVSRETDPYDIAELVLDRLDNPVKLTQSARTAFGVAMRKSMGGLMRAIMQRRDMDMFERLADYGYIDAANIESIVEQSAAWREAEATAYLLEMKRRRFEAADEDDFSF